MGPVDVERRPHWSDDLLAEVGNAIADIPAYDWQAGTVRDAGALLDDYIGHIYAVIAAVEDWQDKQIIGCRSTCVGSQGAEIAELRAQIQRARGGAQQVGVQTSTVTRGR